MLQKFRGVRKDCGDGSLLREFQVYFVRLFLVLLIYLLCLPIKKIKNKKSPVIDVVTSLKSQHTKFHFCSNINLNRKEIGWIRRLSYNLYHEICTVIDDLLNGERSFQSLAT